MSKLFIELLSEEIPYWLQKNIVEQFKKKIIDVIIENKLSVSNKININSNFTPLRLIFSWFRSFFYLHKLSCAWIAGFKRFRVSMEWIY